MVLLGLGGLGSGALMLSGRTHGSAGVDTVLFTGPADDDQLTRGLVLRGLIVKAQMPCQRVVGVRMTEPGQWIVDCMRHSYVVAFDAGGDPRFIERIR